MVATVLLVVRRAIPVILSLAVLAPVALFMSEIEKCLGAYLGYVASPLDLAAVGLAVRYAITGNGRTWWLVTWSLAFLFSLRFLYQFGNMCFAN